MHWVLATLRASSIGRCSLCIRTAFRVALLSSICASSLLGLGSSIVPKWALVLAIGATVLFFGNWMLHVATFSWRRVKASPQNCQNGARRAHLVGFGRAMLMASGLTILGARTAVLAQSDREQCLRRAGVCRDKCSQWSRSCMNDCGQSQSCRTRCYNHYLDCVSSNCDTAPCFR